MLFAKPQLMPLPKMLLLLVWMTVSHVSVAQEAGVPAAASPISIESNSDGVSFSENGKPVLQYQAKPKSKNGEYSRANYIHPLYDLEGNVLTEDFPQDHLHHRGVFWAWHQVRIGDVLAGDSWLTKDFVWDVVKFDAESLPSGGAQLTTKVQWRSPKFTGGDGKQLTIVNETSRIVVHPAKDDCRLVDFEICLLAAVPKVAIGGSEDAKGYGGFSFRVVLPDDIEFQTMDGLVEPQTTAMKCGDWVDMVGTFGKSNSKTGVAIFVHPTSAGYPQTWILRAKKSMQNPVYPGRDAIPLSQSKPTVLRYRIILHRREMTRESLQGMFEEFRRIEFGDPKQSGSDSAQGHRPDQ
jgi:hypothetical protein